MARARVLLLFAALLLCRYVTYAAAETERTLAMIKPDGVSGNYMDKIKERVLESAFKIRGEMLVQLGEGNATLFYAELSSKSFFPTLVKYMTSGPVFVMVLEKANAIADWRALIGPTDAKKAKITHPESIRALCGTDITLNCVHGSDSHKSASREIAFFFGTMFSTGHVFSPHDELRGIKKHDEL
ncbi:hypothetical protein Syun_026606 [Stephania yunnanensis]|uniref:Nucleoside diphosphate kinase-like domain-containing protein n=1 Tax=Stephania yunnanensis TaxID=152371 RepID=A0AAP0ETT8_9MAGN